MFSISIPKLVCIYDQMRFAILQEINIAQITIL